MSLLGPMRRTSLWLPLLLAAACENPAQEPAELPAPSSDVLARYGDKVITVDDVQEQLNRRDAFIRARYQSPEKKKEFLDSVVRFELLADEALKKGYQNDPDIIRMYKQWLVARLVQKDFDPKFDPAAIPEDEVRAYYEQHKEEMRRPDQALAAEIVIKSEALAKKVAERARQLAKDDASGFTEMVLNFSEDSAGQQRGGEMGVITRDSKKFPQPVIDAVFELQNAGDVGGPVKSEDGYHIVRLIKKQVAAVPTFEEVQAMIRERLNKERKDRGMDEWVSELKAEAKVEVFEDKLSEVKVEGTAPPKLSPRPPVFRPGLVPGAEQ